MDSGGCGQIQPRRGRRGVVRRIDYLVDGPGKARLTLALAHGAGAGMDSPFMVHFAE